MNLIKCARNCKYQAEGFCCHDDCGEVKCVNGGCPYYEKNSPTQKVEEFHLNTNLYWSDSKSET